MSRSEGQGRDVAECFISVDVETAGATPATYSMLSLGACLVEDPLESTFYVELKPEKAAFTAEALAVSHLSLDVLEVMVRRRQRRWPASRRGSTRRCPRVTGPSSWAS